MAKKFQNLRDKMSPSAQEKQCVEQKCCLKICIQKIQKNLIKSMSSILARKPTFSRVSCKNDSLLFSEVISSQRIADLGGVGEGAKFTF